MSKVQIEEETIDAAGMAVRGIESGRRVGWAKAFDAMRRLDSLERDINMLRDDNRTLASFAARVYGALEVLLKTDNGGDMMGRLFHGDHLEMQGFLPQGSLNRGRDAMRHLIAFQAGRSDVKAAIDKMDRLRAEIKETRKELGQLRFERDRERQTVKSEVLQEIRDRFAIPDNAEIFRWLGRYARYARKGDR